MLDSGFTEFRLDYSSTKNLCIGHFVRSPEFAAGEHIWRVYCYPRGSESANNGRFLSLYLRLVNGGSGNKKITAIFDTFIMGKDGTPSPVHAKRCLKLYPPGGIGYMALGWQEFERTVLESDYVVDGWVTFICGVVVLREKPVPENPIVVPSSDIQSHLGSLLESADGADVSFRVNGETFPAHRAFVAARSPVFRAELFGTMAESRLSCITLHDIEPAAFQVLLQFMYTDALPGDDKLGDSPFDMLQHLLAAADRYALDRLKLICAQKLWEDVSVDTVADALACAEMYNVLELKKRCIDFVVADKNFKHVVLTDGFIQLGPKFPSIIAELKERLKA
ncbi:hypothetical protein ACP70R_000488 [Stipagrostis hirtigluma subsp. patula]